MEPMMTPVVVHILDKEYQVNCREEERDGLLSAAELLNRQMKEIRDSGKVIGSDRIAVVTALNLAHELLQLKAADRNLSTHIGDLEETLSRALRQETLF